MDYKQLIIELVRRIDDENVLKSLFYILQKIHKRGN